MNLPNALTVARIFAAPVVAALPFIERWDARLFAFLLFLVVAITDYYDGKLARTHGMVTDLGKLLDPIADKLLLLATFIPMFILVGSRASLSLWSPDTVTIAGGVIRAWVQWVPAITTCSRTSRRSACSGCRGGLSPSCSDARRS